MRVTAELTGIDMWYQLQELREEMEVEDNKNLTIEKLRKYRYKSVKRLRQVQQEHSSWRSAFLDQLVERVEEKLGYEKEFAQKLIRRVEKRNRVFMKVKSSRSQQSNQMTWAQVQEDVVEDGNS